MRGDMDVIAEAEIEADAAEGYEKTFREGTPTPERGREDDFREPGDTILDEVPDEMDSKDRDEPS